MSLNTESVNRLIKRSNNISLNKNVLREKLRKFNVKKSCTHWYMVEW